MCATPDFLLLISGHLIYIDLNGFIFKLKSYFKVDMFQKSS